ncbi:MAG: hypothetical protein EZS28_045098, partial [Streblomastix strix]
SKGYSVNSIGDDVDESLIEAESVANIKYHIDTVPMDYVKNKHI